MNPRSDPGTSFGRLIESVRPLADTIWSNVLPLRKGPEPLRIMVTSVEDRSGNTLISTACALGLARNTRQSVVLLEANLRRPAVAGLLGLEPDPGLAEWLSGDLDLESCLLEWPHCPNLTVLPAGGPREPVPGELNEPHVQDALNGLFERGSFVVVDAPPLLESGASRALLDHVDGVVLVLDAGASAKRAAQQTIETVENAGVVVYGSVLNRFRNPLPFMRAE